MSGIIPFDFEGAAVRVMSREGEPWFVLSDVCRVLEISKHRDAAARLDEDERGSVLVDTLGGPQETVAINESGLDSLIFTSRKKAARRFKKWVTAEVLPSIRKKGAYGAQPTSEEWFNRFGRVLFSGTRSARRLPFRSGTGWESALPCPPGRRSGC